MNAPLSKLEAFMARLEAYKPPIVPDYPGYERLKYELVRDFPTLHPGEYTRIVGAISRVTGV